MKKTMSFGLLLLVLGGCTHDGQKVQSNEKETEMIEVSPTEDLMREHGLLARLLLVYDNLATKLAAHEPFEHAILADGLEIMHAFIQEYHEKLEEQYIFPLFEKANNEVTLVKTLLAQHEAGRRLVADMQQLLAHKDLTVLEQEKLSAFLRELVAMYRPHAAREDTVLYPALHTMISQKEFDELGEKFEDTEHERFGKKGFEGIVDKVAGLEKKLLIYDLGQFTPQLQ